MPIEPLGAPDRILRTSDAYRLVLLDRLPAAERQRLGEACLDPDLFAALCPVKGSNVLRQVDRDTALLLLTLRDPGPVPSFISNGWDSRDPNGESWSQRVSSLVAEGFLEVAANNGQNSAAELPGSSLEPIAFALEEAVPEASASRASELRSRIGSLSVEAMRWAAAWAEQCREGIERSLLVRRLYSFHRLPLTSAWRRDLGSVKAMESFIGAERALPAGWCRRPRSLSDDWIFLQREHLDWNDGESVRAGPFKLYISPRPEDLPAAFEALLSVLPDCRVAAVKAAGIAGDVMRPDKLMVYTDRLEAIHDLAQRLLPKLSGLVPHGVPFSAEIGGDGLLSWGADQLCERVPRSWRSWLIEAVAEAMMAVMADREIAQARTQGQGSAVAVLTLDRLRQQGFDVDRWQPTSTLGLQFR